MRHRPSRLLLLVLLTSLVRANASRADEPIGPNIVSIPNLVTLLWIETGGDFNTGRPVTAETFSAGNGDKIGLGGGFLPGGAGAADDLPRIGYDRVLPLRLTLGMDLAFGVSQQVVPVVWFVKPDTRTFSSFSVGVAPRIGYLIPLGSRIAFWPRIGLSYYTRRANDPTPGLCRILP